MKEDNILDEKIDTGFRDLAGNIIYIGSIISNPIHERIFDGYPGVVKLDEDGRLRVYHKSTKNKQGLSSYELSNRIAKNILVIEVEQ